MGVMKVRVLIYVAIASAVGALLGYQNWQIGKLQEKVMLLTEYNATLESSIEQQRETITAFQNSLKEAFANNKLLQEDLKQARISKEKINQKLNSYRGRLYNAALKKPDIIERRANNATARLMRKFTDGTSDQK